MVLLVLSASLLAGLCIFFLKIITELGQSGSFFPNMGLVITLAISLLICSLSQVHILNLAMKYYAQIEAVTIFSAFNIIGDILIGLIVLDEVQYYSTLQLFGFLWAVTLTCFGIKFLTMKTKMIAAQ